MAYVVFKSPIGFHLYDREKNKVISISKDEYKVLSLEKTNTSRERDKIMERFQKGGYCSESTLEKIEHPFTQSLDDLLLRRQSNLVLQVTQNWILRCSYCIYSGEYVNRVHNRRVMTEDIALRAVDFFMERSSAVERPMIGFYGGEPFLEFNLIKKVVSYIEEKYSDRNCGFNLTTNMTLLTDEIIDFIIEKKFSITMSIDGPEEIQNTSRKYANGEGSFAKVMENAKRLQMRDPHAFKSFSTNTVIPPNVDYNVIQQFLDGDETLGQIRSQMSEVSDTGSKEPIVYGDNFYSALNRENFKALLAMVGEIDIGKVSSLHTLYSVEIRKAYEQMKLGGLQNSKSAHPGGPCMPGVKKLFVDVDGNFYPCEKITEQKIFQIGSLDAGFDKEKVLEFLNVARYSEEECKKCWAFSMCTTCGVNMVEGDKMTRKKRLQKCTSVCNTTLGKLADIEILKYYGYDFERENY